ncbi:MAG: hypothetical protein LBR34_10905 [Prevotella sp.]|nr:hypothetical protein [Prevotella sp.]
MKINRPSFRKNLTQLKEICGMLLPNGKSEWLIFGGAALFYLSYSVVIGLYTSITGDKRYLVDIYFSFDVSFFMHPETWQGVFSKHPALPYFIAPFSRFGDLLVFLFGSYKAK